MKITTSIIILPVILVLACTNNPRKMNNKIESDIKDWFENGEWRDGLNAVPDSTVDIEEFYRQYHSNQALWTMAFDYLRTADLENLDPGRYELAGDSLFAMGDVYITKNEEDAKYESHRKYADIQYLISGSERIGVTKFRDPVILQPYDESRDIAFYDIEGGRLRLADQARFFLFFPGDAHRPCIKTGDNKEVKKIVFKVRIN